MKSRCRAPLTVLAMTVLLAAAGCHGGRSSGDSQAKTRADVHGLVQEILDAYGGATALGKVRAYRAEGILTGDPAPRAGRPSCAGSSAPTGSASSCATPTTARCGSCAATRAGAAPTTGRCSRSPARFSSRCDCRPRDWICRYASPSRKAAWCGWIGTTRDARFCACRSATACLLDYHVNRRSHRIERLSMRLSAPAPMETGRGPERVPVGTRGPLSVPGGHLRRGREDRDRAVPLGEDQPRDRSGIDVAGHPSLISER